MTQVRFVVTHEFDVSAPILWAAMVDWEHHGTWIPATRVDLDSDSADTVGATFTGYTGYGPLTLVDRMRIAEIAWDPGTATGTCTVDKLGPVLKGQAGFTVRPTASGSTIDWFEDVDVPYLPRLLAPIVRRLSSAGFKLGMRRLNKLLR